MRQTGWLAVPVALAVLVGAWFGVEALVDTDAPDLGPGVVISPEPASPDEPGGGSDPSESGSPDEPPGPSPSESPSPSPSPSEAVVVPGPAPKPAGNCDPDDDRAATAWAGPAYADEMAEDNAAFSADR